VLRAAVIGVVLALVASPSSPVLCRIWCDARAPAVPGCHHHSDPAVPWRVTSADSCDRMPLSVTPFVREGARHGVLTPYTEQGVVVSRDSLTDAASQPHRSASRSNRTFTRKPTFTALRI